MADYPTHPDEVTIDFLRQATGWSLNDFRVELFGAGAGVIGMVCRVHLTGDDCPDSIIAKFPSPAEENRAVAASYDMYGREYRFYRDIAGDLPLRVPATYYSAYNEDTMDFIILMEDLQGYRIGDQVAGCSLDEAHAVLDWLAGFHANTWEDPAFAHLMSHDNPSQRDGMVGGFGFGWPVVKETFGDLIPASIEAIGDTFADHIPALLSGMCEGPLAVAHADVRLDNIFFGAGDNEGEVALVDWQSICRSAPEMDVAYFITQSVPQNLRDQDALLRHYHAALSSHGIDYSLAALQERYKVAALYLLAYAVVIAGTLDLANERGKALGRTLVGNAMTALDEMNAAELLKS
ncbi:MAG: ecdysteroid 22-kinase family protein [Pseudomonadaceae bacterium]|nr:ecdysteroid 22-kinase family protein [Pseudomonadaceae bacterium]